MNSQTQVLHRYTDLSKIGPDLGVLDKMLTSSTIVLSTELPRGYPILLDNFPTAEKLWSDRDYIRDLVLLPVKSDEDRAAYKLIPKDQLLEEVWGMMRNDPWVFAPNKYPYLLPQGVYQYILWFRHEHVARHKILAVLSQIIATLKLSTDDVIIFERSRVNKNLLTKGTLPEIRHVHFWHR